MIRARDVDIPLISSLLHEMYWGGVTVLCWGLQFSR